MLWHRIVIAAVVFGITLAVAWVLDRALARRVAVAVASDDLDELGLAPLLDGQALAELRHPLGERTDDLERLRRLPQGEVPAQSGFSYVS